MFSTERVASELLGLQQITCSWMRPEEAGHLVYPEFRNVSFLGGLVMNVNSGLAAQSENMNFLGGKLCVLY